MLRCPWQIWCNWPVESWQSSPNSASKHLLNVCQVDSPSELFITAKILSSLVARGTEVGNDLMSDTILFMRALVFSSGLPMVGHGKWGIFLNLGPPCWNISEKFAWVKGKSKCVCWGRQGQSLWVLKYYKLLSNFQPQWAMPKCFEAAGSHVGVCTVLLMTIQKPNLPVHSTGTFWTFKDRVIDLSALGSPSVAVTCCYAHKLFIYHI